MIISISYLRITPRTSFPVLMAGFVLQYDVSYRRIEGKVYENSQKKINSIATFSFQHGKNRKVTTVARSSGDCTPVFPVYIGFPSNIGEDCTVTVYHQQTYNEDECLISDTYTFISMSCPGGSTGGSGSGDSGPYPPGGGSSGDDPPPQPPQDIPCIQAAALTDNTTFKSKMDDLKSKTDYSYETGYLMNTDGTYTSVSGDVDSAEILLSPTVSIDGYIHTHYTGLFPNFSGSDVRAIYQLHKGGKIDSLTTFTAGVVTDDGTTYLMKVRDTAKFIAFGQAHLDTDSAFHQFELEYNLNLYVYNAINTEVTAYEKALLVTLKESGIEIFRGNDNNFNHWRKLTLDENVQSEKTDDSISTSNCSN